MNIIFIVSMKLKEGNACRNRIESFINVALENKFNVTLLSPDDSSFNIGIKNNNFQHIKLNLPESKHINFFKRGYQECKLVWRLLNRTKKIGGNKYMISIPSMFLLFFSFLLPRNKIILDIRDIVWEYLPDNSWLVKTSKFIFTNLGRLLCKRVSLLTVTNESEQQYLIQKYGICESKILIINNGISLSKFHQLQQNKVNLNINQNPVISYIGNLGLAQNLITLLKAAKDLPHINFQIIGTGIEFNKLNQYKTQNKLTNVHFLGPLDWTEILTIYASSEIMYAQISSDYSIAMPSKLYEYLASGRFIIYGGADQAQSILNLFKHNIVIEPDNHLLLIEAIRDTLSTKEYQDISIENQKKIEHHFIRENAAQKLIDYLLIKS